jgi:hypothetical protein
MLMNLSPPKTVNMGSPDGQFALPQRSDDNSALPDK